MIFCLQNFLCLQSVLTLYALSIRFQNTTFFVNVICTCDWYILLLSLYKIFFINHGINCINQFKYSYNYKCLVFIFVCLERQIPPNASLKWNSDFPFNFSPWQRANSFWSIRVSRILVVDLSINNFTCKVSRLSQLLSFTTTQLQRAKQKKFDNMAIMHPTSKLCVIQQLAISFMKNLELIIFAFAGLIIHAFIIDRCSPPFLNPSQD